jgi:glutamyl-tRNA synthetase
MLIAPVAFDTEIAAKKWNSEVVTVLGTYVEKLAAHNGDFTPELAKAILEESAEANGIKLGKVMQAVRLAVTGVGAGPDLMAVFSIIGKDELSNRIKFALETLPVL